MSRTAGPAPATLILLRHGQSLANAQGRFTGWTDVPLTPRGEDEARTAARLLVRDGLRPDAVHTSVLRRSIRTADLVLAELDRAWLPVLRTWRLNERQYGALAGRPKSEVRREVGDDRYRELRRSVTARPAPSPPAELALLRADPRYARLRPDAIPPAETFADVVARITPYWTDELAPALRAGRTVLVVAHGNALRALIAVLDRLDDAAVERLNVPTGAPLLYALTGDLRPVAAGGRYLDPVTAHAAAAAVAAEGH
ncbi:phosphoglycerate mutase [Actinacidiphila alni]|uniref:2,3-bisphosphoglycerate-dependent phosphoglycerate mutase n=1 Tax=Actinacidiphila alni TaxID=380248 RepID=A0A1I2JU41_9ACTN|nr:2,3-bisphosphoglycerate-dependent phosphoglycerate mutase [Actinacidiphila alni]SFF58054.1 phosphoglycerate mutase [Actinacidiphila alni]